MQTVRGDQSLVAMLGLAPDRRLMGEDLLNLPDGEARQVDVPISTATHDRLVAAGSLLTGVTLLAGAALSLLGGWQLLFEGGGAFYLVLAVIGVALAGTHWGWVHIAEYVGLTIDDRQRRASDARRQAWLATIQPYPRFSVSTAVLDDASTRIQRVRHQPVLTARRTFTFVRETDSEEICGADAPAAVVAATVERMRRKARQDTDRLREYWQAAATVYEVALANADDDRRHLAAQRAAATALSEHINASLLEPPLME